MRQIQLFIISFIICGSNAFAQEQPNTFVFEGNNFRWTQTTNGSLFYDETEGLPGLEVPIGEENHSIFTSTLWVGGMNDADELKISFRRFCQNDNENCQENWGPLKLDGSMATPAEVANFNKIWFVTIAQIEAHLAFTECQNNPNCDESIEFPNYEIPEDFSSWPAEGEAGFAENLAPYVDYDSNGAYNPEMGDHPAICGDFSSYTIWNDLGAEGASSDGNEIGLEVHTVVYGYESEQESDFNTLFVQHKLINRGAQALNETYSGFWTDFDLGNPSDDRLRTDVERSMFFVYNGASIDQPSPSGPGYGEDLPAMAVKVLSGPLSPGDLVDNTPEYSSLYANETIGWDDGIIDNERLGLSSAMYQQNSQGPSATQGPQISMEYYNFMRGIWRDNSEQIFGGLGYNPVAIDPVMALYTLPGESDPLLAGTNGIDPDYPFEGGWTEENEEFAPDDRRMIGSSGPFTFAPGDVQYIDLAYIFARESFDDNETVIETLQRFADEVEGMQCSPLPSIVLSADSSIEPKNLTVYPNPAKNEIAFDLPLAQSVMTLFDITGKKIRQARLQGRNQRIDIENLNSGVYLIRIESVNSIYHGKFVVGK